MKVLSLILFLSFFFLFFSFFFFFFFFLLSFQLMFYCKENCDATDMDFYWRIMSSHQTFATNDMQEKSDNEDWCMYRRGDDYPSSLLQPYPDNYQPPPVFEGSTGSASHGRSFSFPVLVLLALLVSLVFLL